MDTRPRAAGYRGRTYLAGRRGRHARGHNEAARGHGFASTERTHQVVIATAAAHLQRALVGVGVDLEHQARVIAQPAREAQVDLDLLRPVAAIAPQQRRARTATSSTGAVLKPRRSSTGRSSRSTRSGGRPAACSSATNSNAWRTWSVGSGRRRPWRASARMIWRGSRAPPSTGKLARLRISAAMAVAWSEAERPARVAAR